MTRRRRLLAATATLWLTCQIGSVVIMPVAAWASAIDLTECLCPHGAGAACPMHQKAESASKMCVIRGVNDQATMVLVTMFGVTAPASKAAVVADPAAVGKVTPTPFSLILLRPSRPEPPPPRA